MAIFSRIIGTFDGQQADSTSKGIVGAPIFWRPESNEQIVYKYPFDNIKNGASVIVHQTQRAFLFLNGAMACAIPSTGEPYVLLTANIPLLGSFLNFATGGYTPNTAEIWFVNIECERTSLWGMGDLPVMDYSMGAEFIIGARGGYNIKVSDAELFIMKLVGTLHSFETDDVLRFFSKKISSVISESISSVVDSQQLSIVAIQKNRSSVERGVMADINNYLKIYGVELTNFAIESYNIPDDYKKVLSEQTKGLAERKRLDKLGVDYTKERQLDIMQNAAANEGASGTIMNAGIGLAMGSGLGSAVGGTMANTFNNFGQPPVPPPLPTNEHIYLAINNQQIGPLSLQQIQQYYSQGMINQQTLYWQQGMASWSPISQNQTIMSLISIIVPPIPNI